MSLLGDFKKGLASLVQSAAGAPMPVVHQLTDLFFNFVKAAADGAAATATADTLFWTNPYDFTVYVVSAKAVMTGAALTNDAANNAAISLKTNDGAGGATAIAATLNTTVAAHGATLLQNQSVAFEVITAANIAIPPGGGLWLNIAKNGTGVVVPVSNYTVRLQRAE
jgi:hypothetical protein